MGQAVPRLRWLRLLDLPWGHERIVGPRLAALVLYEDLLALGDRLDQVLEHNECEPNDGAIGFEARAAREALQPLADVLRENKALSLNAHHTSQAQLAGIRG